MKLKTEQDFTQNPLAGRRIAIIGYGSQGRAHALNLHDSGFDVVVGARRGGPSWARAQRDGLEVAEVTEAADGAALVALLVPDMQQPKVYAQIRESIAPLAALLFAHGFNVHYGAIEPRADLDVVLVAPKGPGRLVRQQYTEGRGVPCLRAVHRNASGRAEEVALAYAHGIGGTRAGVLDTTFAEETETDLFGEQAVLCGGVTELVLKGYETLVEAGYQPEVAYFECMHELKLIVDLLHEGGLARMYEFVSDTAAYGDLVSGPEIVDEHVRDRMAKTLAAIRNGDFARRWMDEHASGGKDFEARKQRRLAHPLEQVGKALRGRMAWLKEDDTERSPQAEHAA